MFGFVIKRAVSGSLIVIKFIARVKKLKSLGMRIKIGGFTLTFGFKGYLLVDNYFVDNLGLSLS